MPSEPKDTAPKIDISSYATPVAADKDLVAVAVLYLTKVEAEAVKAFAQEVKNKRGAKGVQSVTVAWGDRVTTAKQNEDFASTRTNVRADNLPAGWSKFNNAPADRVEYVAPDDTRYVEALNGGLINVLATCNRGHALPKGTSWCKVCEQGGYPDTGAVSPKSKPEPAKPLDRFEGLDL